MAETPATTDLDPKGGTSNDGEYDHGFSSSSDAGISYNGIPGTVICLGGDDGCSVNAAGTLVGGWYFTPNDGDALYVAGSGGTYMVATMYSTYGYWLEYTSGAVSGVALYSTTTAAVNTLDLGQAGTGDNATDVTATYRGSAVGISAHGDKSGQFTADVNLTAKFAATPTLRGSISNFRGNAVGNWSILLNETNLSSTAGFDTNGTTAGGGAPGVWTTQGYGPAPVDPDGDGPITTPVNQRPTGFHGRFNANFGDGTAAGAYATRAVE